MNDGETNETRWRVIATRSDLARSKTIKFSFWREGLQRDGFVALFDGQVVAYENLCRHIPLTLDYGDNRFFTEDGRHFVCETHGAVYEPLTGLCVRGPCQGASLFPIQVELRGAEIWIKDEEPPDAADPIL